VPQYLQHAGIEVIPVPVYYPDVTHILGQQVYRTVAAVPGPVDLINVFRRPQDLEQHVEDLLAKAPKAVWFQLGIRNDAVAARLISGGIDVVQDRCLLVEHQRFARKPRAL
jgi:predicted CoA-binding protein